MSNFSSLFGDNHGLDEKILGTLINVLENKNLPGFDYLEFKQSLAALAKLNIEEVTCIKSAFATAATMGLTKEKLLSSAAFYKQVLAQEKESFESTVQKQMQQRVDGKIKEVVDLKAKVAQYETEVERLKKLIATAQNTIMTADADMQAAKEKIANTRDNFENVFQFTQNQIDKDLQNINTYL